MPQMKIRRMPVNQGKNQKHVHNISYVLLFHSEELTGTTAYLVPIVEVSHKPKSL